MRSTAWTGSGASLGLSLLGISLGAGLAGLVALGGAGEALAQGMTNMGSSGYRSGKAVVGDRKAARPATKGYSFGPGASLKKGATLAPTPRVKGYAYRPKPRRAKRYYYRPLAQRTCGQFNYWSMDKGRCLNARTSPPSLK
jgi:hypothetical protein